MNHENGKHYKAEAQAEAPKSMDLAVACAQRSGIKHVVHAGQPKLITNNGWGHSRIWSITFYTTTSRKPYHFHATTDRRNKIIFAQWRNG